LEKEAKITLASKRTKKAQSVLNEINNLLLTSLDVDNSVDWDCLKHRSIFEVPNPKNNLEKAIAELKESFPKLKIIPQEPYKKIMNLILLFWITSLIH